ncbi:MAG: NYN domain-containing protein [Thiobacillus sp.]|nr:NYN domain-containing protein [Thiobacillus sp.]MDP2977531.1 NYN domain-containing protein [Thiobacillus sp.]
MTHETRIALLIDADNSPAGKIDEVLDELANYGVINIRRAYGDWKSRHLNAWEDVLHEYAIQPIQQFAYTKGKNATDAAMIIDAMDLLYTKQLDGFGIVSSDSDFTPLVMRIRANGLKVFGFGEKKTPSPFVSACSKFLYLETLGAPVETDIKVTAAETGSVAAPAPKAVAVRLAAKELKSDTRLVSLLRKAVEAGADDDGWAGLGAVGQHISKQASFDSRNYGYAKLKDLYQAIGLFEIQTKDKGVYVRDKRASQRQSTIAAQ